MTQACVFHICDDETLRRKRAAELAHAGLRVQSADAGSRIPDAPSVVLVDVPTSGVDLPFLSDLAERAGNFARTLLIFPEGSEVLPALASFADAYLLEPVHTAALAGTIRELMETFDFARMLADNMAQLAWLTDPDGRLLGCNRRWCDYTGQSSQEALGDGWRKAHHPSHAVRIADRFKRSLEANKDWDDTFPIRAHNGQYRWFRTRAMPIRDTEGHITGWCGTSADINREHHFRELADSIPHCIWVTGSGGMEYLNRWYLDYTGFSEEEAYSPGAWKKVVHPEDLPKAEAAWFEFLRDGGNPAIEYRMRRASDGAYRWHLARGKAVRDASGEIVRWIGTITDIHDRKAVEDRLREAQKLESIGLLAGGIAHDFNNLLVGIIGNASFAQALVSDPVKTAECLEAIVKSGERAAHLTRQLLAYAGKGQFVVENVDLAAAVNAAIALLQTSISKKIEIKVEADPGLPGVSADANQIQQIVMNLLQNAAEAIGACPGQISIRLTEIVLERNYIDEHLPGWNPAPGRYVRLEVSDTGSGMDAATKARIFDPFFTTKFQGRGLGLAAVAGIVRAHPGAIQVESAHGAGTTMRIFLRALASQPAAPQETRPNREDLAGAGTILVVDDEEVVRGVARTCLGRHGYEVLEADSASRAIELIRLQGHRLRMVLLDLNMPGMTGDEALPVIRTLAPELPVIVSSGFNEAEVMRSVPGASGFIQKPYDVRTLAQKVKAVLP